MKARHLFMGALALLTLSCANTKEKGQQTSDADSTVVALFDNNVMQSSDDDYDDGVVGLSLPTPLDPGPLDYIPDAETDEVVFFTIANLGHYKNVESMRKGPFWKLLCSLYPDVENINKITVDNGTGDIWLIVPWGENTSLAINEYNMDMFLGEQDQSDGQVYYRTEYAKPMLIRTPMDDPGSIIINAVDNEGNSMSWLPTQEPRTNELREQNGAPNITYDAIYYYAHYDTFYNAFPNNDEISLKFFADRQLFYNGKLGRYMCYHSAAGDMVLYMRCDDMECYGILDGNVDDGKFTLTIKGGTINGVGKGTKLTFEESEGV